MNWLGIFNVLGGKQATTSLSFSKSKHVFQGKQFSEHKQVQASLWSPFISLGMQTRCLLTHSNYLFCPFFCYQVFILVLLVCIVSSSVCLLIFCLLYGLQIFFQFIIHLLILFMMFFCYLEVLKCSYKLCMTCFPPLNLI